MSENKAPFDLQRALAGEPVVHRSGKRIRKVVGFFPELGRHPLLVIDSDDDLLQYTTSGAFESVRQECGLDLLMESSAPEPESPIPALVEALKACQLQMLQSNNDSEHAKRANEMAIAAIATAEAGVTK